MAYKAYDPAIAARKMRNAAIFEETMKICRDGFYVSPLGKKVTLHNVPMRVPAAYKGYGETVVPMYAGQEIGWSVK